MRTSLSLKKIGLSILAIVSLWFILIGPFYLVAMMTHLPGMRGGPQDAFRHTFASSVIAKTISPKIVDFVTELCERDDHSLFDQMDRHNNHIGKILGANSSAVSDLYAQVLTVVQQGEIQNANPNQTTWLPESHWSLGL
jgi:hypothetical protein